MDSTEYETTSGGIWRLGGVVDYFAKPGLACRTATTQTGSDLLAALEEAIAGAEQLLGHPLILDCVNDDDEIEPIAVVTDNGGAMRSIAVARWFAARPHFVHVRSRYRSPGTNGVIERFFEALKYERLFRHDIADGDQLADHVAEFLDD